MDKSYSSLKELTERWEEFVDIYHGTYMTYDLAVKMIKEIIEILFEDVDENCFEHDEDNKILIIHSPYGDVKLINDDNIIFVECSKDFNIKYKEIIDEMNEIKKTINELIEKIDKEII
jgi:hypothetical protein